MVNDDNKDMLYAFLTGGDLALAKEIMALGKYTAVRYQALINTQQTQGKSFREAHLPWKDHTASHSHS